jgi:hypothetical protein
MYSSRAVEVFICDNLRNLRFAVVELLGRRFRRLSQMKLGLLSSKHIIATMHASSFLSCGYRA